ncbi:MAG: fumarate reductase/succinate dehydrogenase flavoprotein subunit, partial [Candidatus Accumulibacter sp.]|jgi:succinate dehydrogenase/fumarate reductase flavoprotein subunit|nr:fumarate reductase/succinate dehydrogenase flavoprotein subunit [Accumulibacter sp.]
MVYGQIAGEDAVDYLDGLALPEYDGEQVARERERILAPLNRPGGLQASKVEYKLRRMVNDYLQPPKVTRKMEIGLQRFAEIREDLDHVRAENPHELMRAMEVHAILDCAELAARASLYRTESRWGLYHYRTDFPERDDAHWNCFAEVRKASDGNPEYFKRPIPDYIVPIGDAEKNAYNELRIEAARA